MHASVFERIGLFATDECIHEIIDWWSRAGDLLVTGVIDKPALRRHIHGDNQTLRPEHQKKADLLSRLRAHRKRLDEEN